MKKISMVMIAFIWFASGLVYAEDAPENLMVGKFVYDRACANCHRPQVANVIRAPAAFNKVAWQQRFQQARENSGPNKRFKTPYDYLVYQVKIGRGLMHHHGLCLESNLAKEYCNDEAYIDAIKYMATLNE